MEEFLEMYVNVRIGGPRQVTLPTSNQNFRYTGGSTPERGTSCGFHLRGLAPG